jgi:hypothetical protein
MRAAESMSELGQTRTRDARFRDRRVDERFDVSIPGGCINYKGSKFPCQILDVSLSGCCVRTDSKFLPGNLAHVEIVMPVMGMVLRMVGTTQWLTQQNLMGIRFFHASSRSKNQLAGLLTGLVDESATEEIKAAVVADAQSGNNFLDMEIPEEVLESHTPASGDDSQDEEDTEDRTPTEKPKNSSENAVIFQDGEEWPATLRLLKDGSHQNGVLADLTQEGCRFQTLNAFASGIHARVEVDFNMRGLPFLLPGVTEDVRNKNMVEIRFLEMSYRKKIELTELLDELREEARKKSAA